MVVKMMKWRPWPPLISKKYEVKLTVLRLEGGDWVDEVAEKDNGGLAVEIRWKGPKISLGTFRRTVKRNCTREENLRRVDDGPNGGVLVEWDEEFHTVCSLSGYKENVFHPWEINFSILHGVNQGAKNKISVVGSAALNLAEYASKTDEQVTEIKIPVMLSAIAVERHPSLCRCTPTEMVQSPVMPLPTPSASGDTSVEKDEVSALKAGLRKVKIFTEYVSTQRSKKACREEEGSEGRYSSKSEEDEYTYPLDSESLDEFEEGESDEGKEDSAVRKSFSYGNWRMLIMQQLIHNSKRSILPWRKRKLSFRSPKAKGEPLLKKAYGEEGGDDIDFDRRQLSSDESLSSGQLKPDEDSNANRSSVSEFGEDSFAVGTWEQKEITSRDGHMKIQAQVFFASIDQRSERAAGESACTALVAVIADWLQNNHNLMPVKSQFDSLIRDGSLEWRNLFPEKSFIGFFHPDAMEGENFEFLHGAMSFDNIWDEISRSESSSNGEAPVFIVSWNDHFFILKVEADAYYIIDTLGERLHEGCNQAYILKFDINTTIYNLPSTSQSSEEKSGGEQRTFSEDSKDGILVTLPEDSPEKEKEEEVVCRGKESCKEYIKNFLAAIPIRELQADMKKGLTMSTPLHHRLQIEFHYTQLQEPASTSPPAMAVTSTAQTVDVAISEVAA
ncbi:UNVERIFIED_CONTAM: hypothetical protein Scaly_1709900 [Sesamum calycinum]|uniref:C2 NT-type domain-containing protein n=1 Tax=Sesamum calycinum TaxID=2727403 RepID=A0AAW2NT00_9LAMI